MYSRWYTESYKGTFLGIESFDQNMVATHQNLLNNHVNITIYYKQHTEQEIKISKVEAVTAR